MYKITTEVSEDVNVRLEKLAKAIDKNKSYLMKEAIENFLEEQEDYLIAMRRLEENGPRISLEQLVKDCGLDN